VDHGESGKHTTTKEVNKEPATDPNKMEICELLDKEFKVII
jgi:hypothetical protein